jgi:hypothetical protein
MSIASDRGASPKAQTGERTYYKVAQPDGFDRVAYRKEYNRTHREQHNEYVRRYRKSHPEQARIYYAKNKERLAKVRRARYEKVKLRVLSFYSRGTPKCSCCTETEIAFLSIDHIQGGGSKHRKTMKAYSIYHWLERNGLPQGFQVLCMNCNVAKGRNGVCPHETRRLSIVV